MTEHELTPPRGCVTALMVAAATYLNHADGYRIRAIVSQPLLRRSDDPVLLVGLTDTTELSWTNGLARVRPTPSPNETAPPALTTERQLTAPVLILVARA